MISTIVALKHEIRMRNVYIAHSNSQKLVRAFLHTVKQTRERVRAAVLSHCVYVCVSIWARAHSCLHMGVWHMCACVCVWVSWWEQGKDKFRREPAEREVCEGRKEGMNESRRQYTMCVCVWEMTPTLGGDKCRAKSKVQELCAPARLRRRCWDAALLYDALLGISWRTWRDTVAPTATPPVIFLLICFGCCFFSSCSARESC